MVSMVDAVDMETSEGLSIVRRWLEGNHPYHPYHPYQPYQPTNHPNHSNHSNLVKMSTIEQVYYQDRTLLHRHAGLDLDLLLYKLLLDNYI
jgi:hypothetical protein